MLDVFFYVCDLVISYRNEVGNKVTSYSTSVSAVVFIYLCDNNHKRRYNIILVHVYNLYKSFLFTLVWSFCVGRKPKHPKKTYPSNVVTTCPSHMSGILTWVSVVRCELHQLQSVCGLVLLYLEVVKMLYKYITESKSKLTTCILIDSAVGTLYGYKEPEPASCMM